MLPQEEHTCPPHAAVADDDFVVRALDAVQGVVCGIQGPNSRSSKFACNESEVGVKGDTAEETQLAYNIQHTTYNI